MAGTRMRAALGGIAATALVALAAPASAQVVVNPTANPTALSDFGNQLLDDGIFLRGHYVGEFAANPSGGNAQSARFAGQVDIGADFDMNKIANLGNSAIHLTFSDRHGQNLAHTDIGNSVSVQEVYGGGQTYKLTELTWDQALFGDRVEYVIGRTDAPSDFAASSFYCNFQTNSTCGNSSLFGQDNNLNYYPVGVWGGRVTVKPTPNLYGQIGAYEQDPNQGDSSTHGFDFGVDRATGYIVPVEFGYQTNFSSDAYPRHYKVGAFYDSGDFNDPFYDINHNSAALTGLAHEQHSGRTSVYGLFDQMVWRADTASQRGLYVFGGVTAGTQSAQTADFFLQAGLLDKGPWASRPDDTIGFVVTDLHFGGLTQDFLRDSRVAAGGSATTQNPNEVMMEVNYGAQITPWLRVLPNLQYIINPDNVPEPSQKSNIPDTFVVGFKFVVGLPELFGLPTKNYNH